MIKIFSSGDKNEGVFGKAFKVGVVVFIFLLLFIPLLTFIGVPHIVFGYNNSEYEDIVDITDKAEYVSSLYRQMDGFSQEYIDSIVAQYSDADEVDVSSDISNTDVYWLIAINSVEKKQDL